MSLPLRTRLQEISCGSVPVEAHPSVIAELAVEASHSIQLAPHPPCMPIAGYNCFEFALGLAGCREVQLIAKHLPSTFCNGEFAEYLVDSVLGPLDSPATGDLVLYRDRDHQQIMHAGVVEANRVISKWGTGHLWVHGLFEVPAEYGDVTSFHEAPVPTEMIAKFVEFARLREGCDLVDSILELQVEP